MKFPFHFPVPSYLVSKLKISTVLAQQLRFSFSLALLEKSVINGFAFIAIILSSAGGGDQCYSEDSNRRWRPLTTHKKPFLQTTRLFREHMKNGLEKSSLQMKCLCKNKSWFEFIKCLFILIFKLNLSNVYSQINIEN